MIRALCIVVHDVAPATWPQCERLLAMIAALGAPPATLLVVPRYHGERGVEGASGFRRAIDALLARGSEVALHGLRHVDDAPAPRTPAGWLRRRVLTAGEGEFAALDGAEAGRRIELGRASLARLGWDFGGFVPPAWLASAGTREALKRSGLRYTSTHHTLVPLPDGERVAAPCLTVSSRSAWRRMASRAWIAALQSASARAPLLRVGLHPADVRCRATMAAWEKLLAQLLADREPLTKSEAMAKFGCARPARYCSSPA